MILSLAHVGKFPLKAFKNKSKVPEKDARREFRGRDGIRNVLS